jgi:hypothetical protein
MSKLSVITGFTGNQITCIICAILPFTSPLNLCLSPNSPCNNPPKTDSNLKLKPPPTSKSEGGSVASVFLRNPQWKIRSLTRCTTSPALQALAAQGMEMVFADFHDTGSLARAFAGANLIFSVTDFWTPVFNAANQLKAKERNKFDWRLRLRS